MEARTVERGRIPNVHDLEKISAEKIEKKRIAADIQARKLELQSNPRSILLLPLTKEGHMMVKILYGFDKIMNAIRMQAGTAIPIEQVVSHLEEADKFIQHYELIAVSLSDGNFRGTGTYQSENPESREFLVRSRSSYVILPRCEESNKMAKLIKRVDPLLMQCRSTCTDFSRVGDTINGIVKGVGGFHELTQRLAVAAKKIYEHPKGIAFFLKKSTD